MNFRESLLLSAGAKSVLADQTVDGISQLGRIRRRHGCERRRVQFPEKSDCLFIGDRNQIVG